MANPADCRSRPASPSPPSSAPTTTPTASNSRPSSRTRWPRPWPKIEEAMGKKFGDAEEPAAGVAAARGARTSMPGMMETVLNVGLCTEDHPRADQEDGQRALRLRRLPPPDHDVLRRGDGEGRRHRAGRGQGHPRAARAHHGRGEESRRAYKTDTDLTADDLKKLCEQFKEKVKEVLGKRVPRRSRGAALGRHRRRVQELERQARRLLSQDRRHSRRVGHRRATCRAWSSATWATTRPPAWPSRATRPPARTSSTASGWSTPRAKTWWPASARPTR